MAKDTTDSHTPVSGRWGALFSSLKTALGTLAAQNITEDDKTTQAMQIAMRISVMSIAVNLILSLGKLLAGIFGHSSAMVSDAIHSASDVISTVVVIVGMALASKGSDTHHPYGHERLECIAAYLLSFLLAGTAFFLGLEAWDKLFSPVNADLNIPGLSAVIAALISIVVKEWMYQITVKAARQIGSPSLHADAWHHRSDAFSSIGALIGIVGARMGLPMMDPAACIVISFFILKASWDIFKDASIKMIDQSADADTVQALRQLALEQEGVLSVDDLRTRLFGARLYVDLEIGADGHQSLFDSHAIAQKVHDAIEQQFPNVKHCMVHVNPK